MPLQGMPAIIAAGGTIPFPVTPVLDDANRADEGPPPSASWSGSVLNDGGMIVSANEFASAGGSALGSAAWGTITSADCEVYEQITATGGSRIWRFFFRMTSLGAAANGYEIRNTLSNLQVRRYDSGVTTTIATFSTGTALVAGDWAGARMTGSLISVYVKRVGGDWVFLDSVTDLTYATGGAIGMAVSNNAKLKNFGGGTI